MDIILLYYGHRHVSPNHVAIYRVARTRIRISLICDKSVTTQNLAFFLCYWDRKKRLKMHFNSYSVITQLAKLAAGEQLCRHCTHRKIIALQNL